MRVLKYAVLCCGVTTLLSSQAHADYLKLYHPKVEKGEASVELNMNYGFDHRSEQDNYFSQVVGAEYGVTDFWQTEIGGEIEKDNSTSNQLTHLKWENVIAPWKPGENYIDTAFYIELEQATRADEPNNFETQLLLEKDLGKFANTANLKLQHEFGQNSADSWGSGLAWQTKYRYDEAFEPGLEYYADFGNFNEHLAFNEASHVAGPVVEGKIGKVKYDTGVLFGVSDAAPDTTVKLNLEYEF